MAKFKKVPGGLFLTLEGPEACGKSTQAKLLTEHYTAQGYEVVSVGEPGGTAYGQSARQVFLAHHRTMVPEAEVGLLVTAKIQLLKEVIEPALKRGAIVVCDRYTDTLMAYQHYAKGHPRELIERMLKCFGATREPDRTVFYYITAECSVRRSARRGEEGGELTDLDTETIDFHNRVIKGYATEITRRLKASGKTDTVRTLTSENSPPEVVLRQTTAWLEDVLASKEAA